MTPELRAQIRRLFFAEHWPIGTIASELHVHHDVVRTALETHRMGPSAAPVRPSILDPYKGFIQQILADHPRLRSTRIYEMLRRRGYTGSAVQLRRYVKTARPKPRAEAFVRRKTLPGEEAQVDWGHFGKITIGRAQRSLSCFVMVLGHSRAMYARFALDQSLESFLRGHVAAFDALGGVPRKILYDNLKSVVIERHGEHVRFHPSILEISGYYHFAPTPCAPYRANEKGKVERMIQYLRHAFFEARRLTTVSELNIEVASWIDTVAHARPCPGDADRRSVREVWLEETQTLLPLPEHPFECERVQLIRSGKTPYVRFDLNDYSIPHESVRAPLTLIASEHQVRLIDDKNQVVARHRRSYDRGAVIEDEQHLRALAEHKRNAHELRGRDRLSVACPASKRLLQALTERGTLLGPQTTRLNKLLDRYSAAELDGAIEEALAAGAVSAEAIAHILAQRHRARGLPPPLLIALPEDPRVRDLEVKPHDLGAYDTIGRTAGEEES